MSAARRPLLYILIGLPATGKTRYRNSMVTHVPFRQWRVVSIDDHVEARAKADGKTYDEVWKDSIANAMGAAMSDFRNAVEARKDIIFDATNLTVQSRARKLNGLPEEYIKYAVVFPEPEITVYTERLNRPGKKINSKDIDVMRKMFVMPTKHEGFDEVVTIED